MIILCRELVDLIRSLAVFNSGRKICLKLEILFDQKGVYLDFANLDNRPPSSAM
jgi:hypothetical protein